MKIPRGKAAELIEKRKLLQMILIDKEGFVLDAVGRMYDPEALSATFLPIRDTILRLKSKLKVDRVEEFSIRTFGRPYRIIMRPFELNNISFSMLIICPLASSYREIISELSKGQIDRIFKSALDEDLKMIPPTQREAPAIQAPLQNMEQSQTGTIVPSLSKEFIDAVSYRVLKKLSSEHIENMIRQQISRITQKMKQERMNRQ